MTAIPQTSIDTPLYKLKYIDDKKQAPPPNHLLETKIYSKLGQNDIVQARPTVLHFCGFSASKTDADEQLMQPQVKKLVLINTSSSVHRMHIIEPQSPFFSIKYTKQKQLVPGGRIVCQIEFKPTEWRYYYDCVRIHTSLGDADNLIIPIHAYPAMLDSDHNSQFPKRLSFAPTPIQRISKQVLPLKNEVPVDFEYQIQFLEFNDSFTVSPMSGVISGNSEISILVKYQPTSFCTSTAKLQVILSQFNASPLICTLIGSSKPGIEIDRDVKHDVTYALVDNSRVTQDDDDVNNNFSEIDVKLTANDAAGEDEDFDSGVSCSSSRVASPLYRARENKRLRLKVAEPKQLKENAEPMKIYKGLKVPKQMNTHQATVNVLMQRQGKLNMQDLREACLSRVSEKHSPSSKQIKEALFEMALRKSIHDERQNQLRWQVKLGCQPITVVETTGVKDSRDAADVEYQRHLEVPIVSDEYDRFNTSCQKKRILRNHENVAPRIASFDDYSNNPYARRHFHLNLFKMAARKVIIRNRVDKRLRQLKEDRERALIESKAESARSARSNRETTPQLHDIEMYENEDITSDMIPDTEDLIELDNDHPLKNFTVDRISLKTFATYQSPNVKDDMAVDALGIVAYKPTTINVVDDVPYFPLKVPHMYQLLGYKEFDVHNAATNYVPVSSDRPLRTGAEDEFVRLSDEVIASFEKDEHLAGLVEGSSADGGATCANSSRPMYAELKPPAAMFERIKYPRMHVFNPSPMVCAYSKQRPYSEISDDYQLCAIPHCIPGTLPVQRTYLHKQDVIKGMMLWKKFPSQGLTALSNTPTLTNVWAPRWTDTFGEDMLSSEVPAPLCENSIQLLDYAGPEDAEKLTGKPEIDDKDDIDEDDILTPEMIAANFFILPLPTTNMSKDAKLGTKSSEMFPEGSKMPSTNLPVNSRGPVPREKRECELSYFLKKKYNRLGSKVKSRVENVNRLTTMPQLKLPH